MPYKDIELEIRLLVTNTNDSFQATCHSISKIARKGLIYLVFHVDICCKPFQHTMQTLLVFTNLNVLHAISFTTYNSFVQIKSSKTIIQLKSTND